MWRIIGGVVGGFVASQVIVSIVITIIAIVLGREGIVTADKAPTSTWMAVILVAGAIGGYIAGAIARAIAKDKKVIFAYIATSVFFTILFVGLAKFGPKPPEPKAPKQEPPEWAKSLMAMGEAQKGAPTWMLLGGTLVTLAGVCLGGLSGKDFGPQAPAADKPVA